MVEWAWKQYQEIQECLCVSVTLCYVLKYMCVSTCVVYEYAVFLARRRRLIYIQCRD